MDRAGEMTVFVKVAEQGSFSSAARDLGQTPSAVSKLIGRLEDRLGVRLIHRTTRKLSLTEEGEAFFQRAVRILADIDEAELAVSSLHASPRGVLRVNSGVAFGKRVIGPLLPEFLAQYPEVSIEFTQSDAMVDLVEEGVDVAIRFGDLKDSSMVARFLAGSRRAVVASPDYLEKHGMPSHPDDLARHNLIGFSMQQHLNSWVFQDNGVERPIQVQGNFTANNGETLFEMVLAGLGVARMAEFLVGPAAKEGRLVRILTDYYRDVTVPIHAIYPNRRHLSPKVRAFVDFLVLRFTPKPPWAR